MWIILQQTPKNFQLRGKSCLFQNRRAKTTLAAIKFIYLTIESEVPVHWLPHWMIMGHFGPLQHIYYELYWEMKLLVKIWHHLIINLWFEHLYWDPSLEWSKYPMWKYRFLQVFSRSYAGGFIVSIAVDIVATLNFQFCALQGTLNLLFLWPWSRSGTF